MISTIRLDLLDLFGRGYVVEHCISTHNALMQEKMYKVYMSDLLAWVAKGMGTTVDKRFYDLAYQQRAEETRTPEEIINTISEKLAKLGEGET